VVGLIREVEGLVLVMLVERGDHIVPNIKECFPIKSTEEIEKMGEADRMAYYAEAMRRGLGSRLQQPFFTTVGKIKVKVPKYNNPRDLYSDGIMDEMISGSSVDPEKLDPNSKAFEKLKKIKSFDPKRSSVLSVINDISELNGNSLEDSEKPKLTNDSDSGRKI